MVIIWDGVEELYWLGVCVNRIKGGDGIDVERIWYRVVIWFGWV